MCGARRGARAGASQPMSSKDLKNRLARLPRCAIAAFIARCAQRVRPLAEVLPEDSRIAIDHAIMMAIMVARGHVLTRAAVVTTRAAAETAAEAAVWAEDGSVRS